MVLRALVRKIIIVKQFLRRAYGNIDISSRIDEPKRVYSTAVAEMLSIAQTAYLETNRLIVAETLLSIVRCFFALNLSGVALVACS